MLVACLGAASAVPAAPAGGAPAPSPVRFAPERDYGPFVFETEDGRIDGLSIDMLRLIQHRTGLVVTMVPARPLSEQLAAAQRGEVDLLSSLRPTPERGRFLRFSLPYVSVPAVLVAPAGGPGSLDALAGQPVAVGAGYAVEGFVRASHPEVTWVAVPDDVAALQGVAAGRYRAAVVDAASFRFVAGRHGIGSLVPVAQVGFEYRLSFAVPLARQDLVPLLDKAIVELPAADRQAVLRRWMPDDAMSAPARTPWATRLGLGMIAVAGLLAWGGVAWRRRRPA